MSGARHWWKAVPEAYKVPLVVAGFMIVVGLVASHLVVRGLVNTQEREFQRLVDLETEYLSVTLGPLLLRDDIWEMFALLDLATQRRTGPRPVLITLVSATGQTIVSSDPVAHPIGRSYAGENTGSASGEGDEDGPSRRAVTRQILYQDMPRASMVIDFDVADMLNERELATRTLLLGNAFATVLLAFVGYVLVKLYMRPITYLMSAMGAATGRFEPIPPDRIPSGESEIAKLYQTYNMLLASVEKRKSAERRLAERERLVSLGRLAGKIAHEVNNPLGGLLNAVDTIKTYNERSAIVLDSAELLERGLTQLRDIVRSTLDVYREGGAKATLGRADLDDLCQLIKPEASKLGQHLDWSVDVPEEVLALFPSGKVRQIVLNLLLNASHISGLQGQIGFRAWTEGDRLLMAVTDSGPGMRPEEKARLLEEQPSESGAGLGLHLVRELTLSLSGNIKVGFAANGRHQISIALPLTNGGKADAA